MFLLSHSFSPSVRLFISMVAAGVILVSCGPTTTNPVSQASPYDRAKDAFKSGDLDKALDLTEKLATVTPPADSTDRARVLRAVIFAGQLKGTKELAEGYHKGVEKTTSPADPVRVSALATRHSRRRRESGVRSGRNGASDRSGRRDGQRTDFGGKLPRHRRPTRN